MCIRLAAVVVAAACGSSPRPPTETSPAKPEPSVTTAAPRPPRANVPMGSGTYGTAHPTYFRGFDTRGKRWMALCQARRDTDGDGKIEVSSGHHGGLYGDDMALYLVIGGGEGTVIEALVSRSDDDRWLAILRDGTLELVDVETGDVRAMVDADVESDERPGAPHRAATFVGERLLYIRNYADKDTLVVYDLASRKEREITVPDRLWRIVWSRTLGRIYTVPRGQGSRSYRPRSTPANAPDRSCRTARTASRARRRRSAGSISTAVRSCRLLRIPTSQPKRPRRTSRSLQATTWGPRAGSC